MLGQFKINEEDVVRVPEDRLRSTVSAILMKMNVPDEDAWLAADVLVTADLRGVDSHGVSNLLRGYVQGYSSGLFNARPQWRIAQETLCAATVDCDGGLGVIIAPKAMELAIKKAKETGVGVVTARNGHHLGMASYHAMLALEHDMVGLCLTSANPIVLPTFGSEPRLGTNPIALAAPTRVEHPFVYDAATSVVAGNKIGIARRLGRILPPGWIADEEGTPIMESIDPPEKYRVLPLGSTQELGSYKGYGLACVVDILAGILSGGGYGMVAGSGFNNHFFTAYNIEAFTSVSQFKDMMDDFLRELKDTPPAPGHQRVLVPGQLEWETEQERRANGIPLHNEVTQWLHDICEEMTIPLAL